MKKLILALAAVSASGCLSIGGVQRAETLGKGNFQVAIEPGALGVFSTAAAVILPTVDFSGRYGIHDRVDLGLRLGATGAELQTKFLFTDPLNRTLAISIAPTFGGVFLGVLNYAALNVPLLIGFKFGEHEFTLGPRLVAQFIGGSSAPTGGASATVIMPGTSVGLALQINDYFSLLPEISVVVPVVGAFATSSGSTGASSASGVVPVAQFKLGIQFGRKRPNHDEVIDTVIQRGDAYPLPPPPPPPSDLPTPARPNGEPSAPPMPPTNP